VLQVTRPMPTTSAAKHTGGTPPTQLFFASGFKEALPTFYTAGHQDLANGVSALRAQSVLSC